MLRNVFKGMPLGGPTTTWLTMSTETHALKGRRADRGLLLVRTLAGVERLLEANLSNALDRPQDIANGRIPHFVDRNSFVREVFRISGCMLFARPISLQAKTVQVALRKCNLL